MLDYRQETAIWDGHAAEVYGGVMMRSIVRTETPETVTILGPDSKLPHLLVRARRHNGEVVTVERSSLVSDSQCEP